MHSAKILVEKLNKNAYAKTFSQLYPANQATHQKQRYIKAIAEFMKIYGEDAKRELTFISAPGRTEVGGNHTDHQRGRVLAASVNLDIICVVAKNSENVVRIESEGYKQDVIDLRVLSVQQAEKGKAISLIRGVMARFNQLGYNIGGFDAYTTSDVLKGSGLSSSAAFEVAVGTILNYVYNEGKISPVEIAQIGQYAENVFFDKPCGLMDQMASSVGGFVEIDFKDPEKPVVESVDFDFTNSGHTLCIVDTKGDHADLTDEYAAIPQEMGSIAKFFGKQYLRDVDLNQFYMKLPALRKKFGDRAVLRSMHFFGDNERVLQEVAALRLGDFEKFKELIIESGRSSSDMLQNVFATPSPNQQGLSVALAISSMLLQNKGAWRVHGGGFAGTIQAFVPNEILEQYRAFMEKIFGKGSCYELMIRPFGGIEVKEEL